MTWGGVEGAGRTIKLPGNSTTDVELSQSTGNQAHLPTERDPSFLNQDSDLSAVLCEDQSGHEHKQRKLSAMSSTGKEFYLTVASIFAVAGDQSDGSKYHDTSHQVETEEEAISVAAV